MSTFINAFNQILDMNGMSDHKDKGEKFEALFTSLVETNKLFNLTAVTDEQGVAGLHFVDSLMAMEYIAKIKASNLDKKQLLTSILDVGCGAGFPCLPIAIADPELSVTGLDSTAKKTEFSNSFAKANGIENFRSIAGRAEELAKTDMRESYDLVTARAVSRLNVLCEITLPFVKVGGYFLAMKGSKGKEECEEAKKGIEILGGKLISIEEKELILPNETQKRIMILVKKVKNTEHKYPRAYGKIVKSPLK